MIKKILKKIFKLFFPPPFNPNTVEWIDFRTIRNTQRKKDIYKKLK